MTYWQEYCLEMLLHLRIHLQICDKNAEDGAPQAQAQPASPNQESVFLMRVWLAGDDIC